MSRQSWVQFGLRATRPLKDYPRNNGIISNATNILRVMTFNTVEIQQSTMSNVAEILQGLTSNAAAILHALTSNAA